MKKKSLKIQKVEKELIDYFTQQKVEPDEIGRKILVLVKHYGTVEKTSEVLGITTDSINYYIQYLSVFESILSKI